VDYNRPLYLILPSLDALPAILSDLRAIGVDDIPGYFGPDVAAHKSQSLPLITAEELAQRMSRNGLTVLDVRGRSEYLEQHIRGARHIPLGYLPQRINELPQDKLIVTQCATGYRSQIAASILQAAGFKYATALNEGAEVWGQFLPTEPEIIPIQAAGEK
jgi:hydroxyacylglutathione hydrolase